MNHKTICDICQSEFEIEELQIKEAKVKRGKKEVECIVQFFDCPECEQTFIVCVYDEKINKLNHKYTDLMRNHEGMSQKEFINAADKLKKQILAEESMLQHLYMKQNKETLKLM